MNNSENFIIITGTKLKAALDRFLSFKRFFYSIPKENIILVEEIEKSNFFKKIKDEDIIPEVINEYKKVMDTSNLNPIQQEGKAKFFFKMSRAIKSKIKDLYDKKKIDYILFVGDPHIIPIYCC